MRKSIGLFSLALVMIAFDVSLREEQQITEPKDTMVLNIDRAEVELNDIEKEDDPTGN